MKYRVHRLALFVLCAAGLVPATAQAQWRGADRARPAPLYPYELQPGQPYAVEVAPGTYVIHRPKTRHRYPYVGCGSACGRPARTRSYRTERRPRRHHTARHAPKPRRFDRPPKRNDPALIEKLRRRVARHSKYSKHSKHSTKHPARHADKRIVIHTKKVVREKPVVIVHRRVVEDPPRVIVRRHYVEDAPAARRAPARHARNGKAAGDEEKRVIRAEAEVTILGPDRMSIRLYRKGDSDAGARVIKRR